MSDEQRGAASEESRREVTRRRARRVRRGWVAAVALVTVGAAVLLAAGLRLGGCLSTALRLPGAAAPAAETATLFFADPRWTSLIPEAREIQPQGDATAKIRALVEALAEGPRAGAAPVLPPSARLRNVYLGKDGVAFIDFESDTEEFGAGGVSGEILAVFSLVHTVAQNVAGIQAVQILVGGQPRESLAGHVKISEPLRPDPQWLGRGR